MKRGLQIIAATLFGMAVNAQETPVVAGTVTMGAGYGNNVYYKLSDQTSNTFANNAWDVAFYRRSSMAFAIRVNDAKAIEVYQASSTLSDWATIDVSAASTATRLYNSETEWTDGAFQQGSATYGWGEYNPVTHHVYGTVAFLLKYSDGSFKKFRIDDFFGGYTFTYASWDGAGWGADTTYTLANTQNPTAEFNYYSLVNNAAVVAEPATTAWDFVFTRYYSATPAPGGGSVMYPVTGVLHHPSITVAENVGTDTAGLTYSALINSIGSDWKTFTGAAYTVDSAKNFYIKNAAGTIYKVNFNTFTGSSTGITTFNQQDVTAALGTDTFENNVSFGIYPNPSTDKRVNLVYELPAGNSDENVVTIYSLTGAKVYESKINNAGGFFNKEINLQNLNSGIYLLKFESGKYSTTKKLVLK